MSNLFSKPQSATPQALPGYEWLAPFLQSVSQQAQGGMNQGYWDVLMGPPGSTSNAYTGWVKQGADTLAGFDPTSYMAELSQKLAPVMVDQPFIKGAGDLREQAALTGNLPGSATQGNVVDLYSGLVQGLNAALPGLASQLGGLQLGAASGLTDLGLKGLGMAQGGSQFQQGLPIQLLAALGGLQGNSMWQPTYGSSKFDSLMGLGGSVMGAAGSAGGFKNLF